ncbi:MAG: helix-turn-helix domain-containing protein [Boseongicola sp. SB0662_bin_57]|nr:helix-turn-helix domain-containing protein [Boseongicola sp. SB0665_bin_10]MYA88965.1 helix-turn-helix domain-containing protein [Boseongicola sp. SB0662_bin_57]MYG25066.1 helix-turn-helix domain-containing protein [Boseongicola sp. SB0677_bin_26]
MTNEPVFETNKFYDSKDLEKALHVPYHTLSKWRMHTKGPAFHKIGNRALYRGDDLNAWLDGQRVDTAA